MNTVSAKQIWDEVFDGKVQNATDWSRRERNTGLANKYQTRPINEPLALYLEPSLVSNNGHQLTLAACYVNEFKNQGYQTLVAHSFKNSLPEDASRLPYFLVQHHTMVSRSITSTAELEKVRHYFLSEFEEVIGQYIPQVCVFATIRFTNVLAAAEALISCNVQYAIFGVMEAEAVPDCKNVDIIRSAFSQAAKVLHKQGITHLFIAETEYVKTFLLGCGFRNKDVKVFPYVAAKLITELTAPLGETPDKIHVGYLGGSRPVRHPELIAEMLVSESLATSVSFSVQLDLNYIKSKCGQELCDKIIALDKKGLIKLYSPNLSHQEYRALFCSLDFVIMPYGERYHQIGSGVFFEAIYAGVIPICAADSKIHEMYTSLGGAASCFKSLSAQAIREAIVDGVQRFTVLRKSAIKVRENWHQHPSSAEQWQAALADWLPTHFE